MGALDAVLWAFSLQKIKEKASAFLESLRKHAVHHICSTAGFLRNLVAHVPGVSGSHTVNTQ